MAIGSKSTSTTNAYFFSSSAAAASSSRAAAAAESDELDFLGAAVAPPLRVQPSIGEGGLTPIDKLILDLSDSDRREKTLAELSVKRALFQDLAPRLWFSFGTVAILLQEVISVYPFLSPTALTVAQSNRACNALALLQCMASNLDTRMHFLQANVPLYVYPFLSTSCKTKPFEYLRLTTLGVIGALVKVPDTVVILFLLSSEIMPLCLLAMETGTELSKTVSTFILQRILLDDLGLDYVCYMPERLFAVNQALGNVVAALVEHPSARLFKLVIRCYLRFSEDERSLWLLRYRLPKRLTDGTFNPLLWEDPTMRLWLQQLLDNVRRPPFAQEGVRNHKMASILPIPM